MINRLRLAAAAAAISLAAALPAAATDLPLRERYYAPLRVSIDANIVGSPNPQCYFIVHLKSAGKPVSGAVVRLGFDLLAESNPGTGIYRNDNLPVPGVGQGLRLTITAGKSAVEATTRMTKSLTLTTPKNGQAFSRSSGGGIPFQWTIMGPPESIRLLVTQWGVSAQPIQKILHDFGCVLAFTELQPQTTAIDAKLFLKASDPFVFSGAVDPSSSGVVLYRVEVNCKIL